MRLRRRSRISLATTCLLPRLRLLLPRTAACRAAGSPGWARKASRLNTLYALKYFYSLDLLSRRRRSRLLLYTLTNSAEILADFPHAYARMAPALNPVNLRDLSTVLNRGRRGIEAQDLARLEL